MGAMSKERNELYEFGGFRLNVGEHKLERLVDKSSVSLPEKAFQTLCILVENRGHLLSKKELLDQLWPDSFVEENNLDKCIHILRHVLGERPGERRYIETVRKHGYRFVAEVIRIRYTEPKTESGRFIFPEEIRQLSLTTRSGIEELHPLIIQDAEHQIRGSAQESGDPQIQKTLPDNRRRPGRARTLAIVITAVAVLALIFGFYSFFYVR